MLVVLFDLVPFLSISSLGNPITSPTPPLLKPRESSSGVKVHLPAVPAPNSITNLPSSSNSMQLLHNNHSVPPHNPSKEDTPSKPDTPIQSTHPSKQSLKDRPHTPDKLPPIVSTQRSTQTSHDPTWPNTITRPLPLLSQLKLTRRTSTFKATPLGYRPYPSQDRERKEEDLVTEDLRLLEPNDDEQTMAVSFNMSTEVPTLSGEDQNGKQNRVESPLASSHGETQNGMESSFPGSHSDGREAQNGVEFGIDEGVESQQTAARLDEDDQRAVLNQVERFDRLMKVLHLLKSAGQMEDLEPSGVDGVVDLKEHIRVALDEAVQLRRETEAMQSKIRVRRGRVVR